MVTYKISDRKSPKEMALAKQIDCSVFFDIDSVRYVPWPSTHPVRSSSNFEHCLFSIDEVVPGVRWKVSRYCHPYGRTQKDRAAMAVTVHRFLS